MTHIVAGYPTLRESEDIALMMLESGVQFLEIQIPFSDPVADGPVIMKANQIALDNGTTPDMCFELMQRLKKKSDIPLLFMTYYNILFRYGLEEFCRRAKEVGCYGFIVPDIPIDEEPYDHYLETCKRYGLHAIQVISPITPDERLKKIGKVASGFVYCISMLGTTGSLDGLPPELSDYIGRVRKYVTTKLALGFGISSKMDVENALKDADIAVMGSVFIRTYEKGGKNSLQQLLESL
ncbi:MAG: tryptophan synthase subunit alpha [Candidatus Altimarinota bacterium]